MDEEISEYRPEAIANFFLEKAEEAGDTLSPMKILKLVYYAHGWNLALKGEPLIDETVEAWKFGPVVESLYRKLSKYGSSPITEKIDITSSGDRVAETTAKGKESLLEEVWQAYGEISAMRLSKMTHRPGTPWHEVLQECGGRLPRNKDIDNEKIEAHFKDLADRD